MSMFTKLFLALVLVLSIPAVTVASAVTEDSQNLTKIVINKKSLSLEQGKSADLEVTAYYGSKKEDVTPFLDRTSSNEKIAK